jgi:hypothetical protein
MNFVTFGSGNMYKTIFLITEVGLNKLEWLSIFKPIQYFFNKTMN